MDKFEKIVDYKAEIIGIVVFVFFIIGCCFIPGLTDLWQPETVPIKLICSDVQVDPNEPCKYIAYTELKVENGGIRPFDIWCPKCFSQLMWYTDESRR